MDAQNSLTWLQHTTPRPVAPGPVAPRGSQRINQGSPLVHSNDSQSQGQHAAARRGHSTHPSNLLSPAGWSLHPAADYYNYGPSTIKAPSSLITHSTTNSQHSTTSIHHRFGDQRERLAATGIIACTRPSEVLASSSVRSASPSSRPSSTTGWYIDPALGLDCSISTLAVDSKESPTFAYTHQSPAPTSAVSTPARPADASPSEPQHHIGLLTPPDDPAFLSFASVGQDLLFASPDSAIGLPAVKLPWSVSYSPVSASASASLGSTLAISATASTFSDAYSPRQPSWSAAQAFRHTPPGSARNSLSGWSSPVPALHTQDPLMWVDRSPSSGISELRSTMAAPADVNADMRPAWEAPTDSVPSSDSHEGDQSVQSAISRTNSLASDHHQPGQENPMQGDYDHRQQQSMERGEDSGVRGELRRDWKFESPQGRKHVPPPLMQSRSYTYGASGQPPPQHYVPETSWQPVGLATPTSMDRGFGELQMPPHEMYQGQPNTPRQFSPQEGLSAYVTSRPAARTNEFELNRPPPFGFVIPHSADPNGGPGPRLVTLPHAARAPIGNYYPEDYGHQGGGQQYMTASQYANYVQSVTLRPPHPDWQQQLQQQNQAVATSHLRSQSFGQAIQRQSSMNNMGPPVPHHNVFSYVQPQGASGVSDSPHHSDVSLDSSHHKAHSVGSRSSAESLTSGSISYNHAPMPRQIGGPYGPPEGGITYMSDANVKQTETLKRQCFTCKSRDPPSWRRSILDETRILCNRCGIFERSHGFARTPDMMGKPIAKPKHKIITGRPVKRKQSVMPDYEQDGPDDQMMGDRGMGGHFRQDSYQSSGYTHSGTSSSFSPITPWSSSGGSWPGKTPNSATINKKRSRANTGASANDVAINAHMDGMMEQPGNYPQTHARHDSLRSMSISYPPDQPGQDPKPSIRLAHTARAPSWTGNPSS